MNPFIQSAIGFLSLIQPSPELFAEWRGAITFDRILVASSLVGSMVWWRYQRSYCVELQKQYSELLKEHTVLAARLTGLESSFKKLQETGVEALKAQNSSINNLAKNLKKQIDSVAQSGKQTADLTTVLTSAIAKHGTELDLLMQIRNQLLGIAKNQNAQIEELRGQIQRMVSPNSDTSSRAEQQKSKKEKTPTAALSVKGETQAPSTVYSVPFDQSSKIAELATKLGTPHSLATPRFLTPNLGQSSMMLSGIGNVNIFQSPTNNSGTD